MRRGLVDDPSALTSTRLRLLDSNALVLAAGVFLGLAIGYGVLRSTDVLIVLAAACAFVWANWSMPTFLALTIPAFAFAASGSSVDVSPTLLAFVPIGVWGLGVLDRRWRVDQRVHLAIGLLLVWVVMARLVHSSGSTQPDGSFAGICAGLGLAAVAASIRPSRRLLMVSLVLTGCVLSVASLATNPFADLRSSVYLGFNANSLGLLLALSLVAAVALLTEQSVMLRIFGAATTPLLIAAILNTESRGAYASALAGLLIVIVVGRSARAKLLLGLAAVALLVLTPGTLTTFREVAIGGRTVIDLESSGSVRIDAARLSTSLAITHPVFGIGFGEFPDRARQDDAVGITINTHNDFLGLAVSAGLPALAFLLWLLWLALRRGFRAPDDRAWSAIVVAGAVGFLTANTLGTLAVSGAFWLALGAVASRADTSPVELAPRRALDRSRESVGES